jgi:hypothetical protein
MSVFTRTNSKVLNSDYIRTDNKSIDEGTKPAEPAQPEQAESK